jgi:hypothetical protein
LYDDFLCGRLSPTRRPRFPSGIGGREERPRLAVDPGGGRGPEEAVAALGEGLVLQPDEFELWKVEAGNRNEGGTEPTVATFHVFAYVVDCE